GRILAKLDDANWDVRRAAVAALGSLVASDEGVRLKIAARLADESWFVRFAAAQTLYPHIYIQDGLFEQLFYWIILDVDHRYTPSNEMEDCQLFQAQLIADYAPKVQHSAHYLTQLQHMLSVRNSPTRIAAAKMLMALPQSIPPHLRPTVIDLIDVQRGDESWPERLQVAEFFINHRDQSLSQHAIRVALEALDYATEPWVYQPGAGPQVRSQSAQILGKLEPLYRDEAIFVRLRRLMIEDQAPNVRDAAYGALLQLAVAPDQAAVL
nr:HEAT repeat domain-containing protein [Anaerolineae bacterium]